MSFDDIPEDRFDEHDQCKRQISQLEQQLADARAAFTTEQAMLRNDAAWDELRAENERLKDTVAEGLETLQNERVGLKWSFDIMRESAVKYAQQLADAIKSTQVLDVNHLAEPDENGCSCELHRILRVASKARVDAAFDAGVRASEYVVQATIGAGSDERGDWVYREEAMMAIRALKRQQAGESARTGEGQ